MGPSGVTCSINSRLPPNAPTGTPPPIALANVTRSPSMPQYSVAPPGAILHPNLTSSMIITEPFAVQRARTASRYPGIGGITPPFVIAGSTMTPATSPSCSSKTAFICSMSLNWTTTVYSVEAGSRPAESAVELGWSSLPHASRGAPPVEMSRSSVPPWY
jgi:hypothetical protein